MTNFDWGRFAEACEVAEVQWQTNVPLGASPPAPPVSIATAMRAIQPFVTKAAEIVATRPGAIVAALTLLTELSRQGIEGAAEIEDLVVAAAGFAPTAASDLAKAISLLEVFAPASEGIQGDNHTVGRG